MIVGYPTPGKDKARMILHALCTGANGKLADRYQPGTAAFYGVVEATKPMWRQAKFEGRDWIYVDNAYLDSTREVYFRATRNRLQHCGLGVSDGKRFERHYIPILPWRKAGSHILICPQSDQFMREVVEYSGSWLADTVAELKTLTDRPIRVRPWNGNKREWYRTLGEDLNDCWALVTFSSASAITATLQGIPAIVTAEDCIARPVTGRLADIENPPLVDCRREWAGVVADHQWTLEEMRSGLTWRMLNG